MKIVKRGMLLVNIVDGQKATVVHINRGCKDVLDFISIVYDMEWDDETGIHGDEYCGIQSLIDSGWREDNGGDSHGDSHADGTNDGV